MAYLLTYLLACGAVAYLGRNTLAGPCGFFIISLLLTPLFSCIILALTIRRESGT